jgi:hypothetical protein
MVSNHDELSNRELLIKFNELENRVSQIEYAIKRKKEPVTIEDTEVPEAVRQIKDITDGSLLESKIGESGLAWLGNLVLFFGMVFLVEHLQKSGFQIFAPLLGYAAVTGIFFLSYYLKENYPRMSRIFNLNAYLLLFYVTLNLHYFTLNPVIKNNVLGLVFVALVPAVQLIISLKNRTPLLTGFSIILFSIVGIVSDATHFMLPIAVFIAATGVFTLHRFGWMRLLYLSISFSYLVFLLWFMNNPIMGHPLQAVQEASFGYLYLFSIGFIYSLPSLFKESEKITSGNVVGAIVLNGLGFSILLLLFILTFFADDFVALVSSISLFCLFYSVLLKIRSEWKITAALYALYGFVTMSAAIHGIYDFPRAYFLLAIQSLLVVTMAIWFRSRFIVVMNTLLFLILLTFYLKTSDQINGVNISFSITALLTARILNWKKDRLTIKTDLLRNVYLLTAFIMVLVTLYQLVSASYVTLSWTAAALVYFIMSLILRNVKYRYLALGTMLAATFYLFIIDLARIELVFRIMAFMFLAVISIGLSIYYSRRSKRKAEN